MFDIEFYMKAHGLKQILARGPKRESEVAWLLEEYRSKRPVVFNIETTNACNMRCRMCPRTTMMTRPVKTMDLATFQRVIDQLEPWTGEAWARWVEFAERRYQVPRDGMSENHFFLYVIPKVIVLHGYGDPLLDPLMPERVRRMSARGLPSYFSCNPANIDFERTMETFAAGLGYVKYSVESVDDQTHKSIRGEASNFSQAYKSILAVLDEKARRGYSTEVVITMIDLNRPDQGEQFERLAEAFRGLPVYIYLKSQDQQWYEDGGYDNRSIHWSEFCQFPWSSMTVKSDGLAAMCVEDFDNEIILGDAKTESLEAIWNGEKYRAFRQQHLDLAGGIKCTGQCDMTLIGELIDA